MERLDKLLANRSPLSRKEAGEALHQGRVLVDGEVVRDGAMKLDPDLHRIALDGQPLRAERHLYLMMHKPAGYVTSTEERGQPTVLELLSPEIAAFSPFPAGRLDKETEGLLLLTTDGDFCHRIISPKTGIPRRYFLRAADPLSPEDVKALGQGIVLADGTVCKPAALAIGPDSREAEITVWEGKYHEVRRLIASRGNKVIYLKRLSIGGLSLDSQLPPGGCRELTKTDITSIFQRIPSENGIPVKKTKSF